MTDKAFLWSIAGLLAFLGWRQWSMPVGDRSIEFMPVEVFGVAFVAAALAVAIFIVHPSSFWRVLSGGVVVMAVTTRAAAGLYAGYEDKVIPVSRAQMGFAAWMLGAVLATFVWTRLYAPRRG